MFHPIKNSRPTSSENKRILNICNRKQNKRQQDTSSSDDSSDQSDRLSDQESSSQSGPEMAGPPDSKKSDDALTKLKELLDTLGDKKETEEDTKKELEKKRKRLELEWDVKSFQYQHETLDNKLRLQRERDFLQLNNEIQDLDMRQKRQKLDPDLELKKQQTQTELDYLRLQITRKEREQEWKDWVDGQAEYLVDPVMKNPRTGEVEIVMSDRVITLDEVITYRTAEKITERIHYFNNQNRQYPIFLMIDFCVGGSVMAGFRIQKTMDSSPAPVYVIVKSFAASMAASIASNAKYSFIYPNAIMMHHQILTSLRGNLTQLREGVDDLKRWWERSAGPLCKKLGITLDEWIQRMYEHNSDGDWEEFGDRAVELGWIDSVVHRMRQTGHLRHPDWKLREDNFFRTPFLPFTNQQQSGASTDSQTGHAAPTINESDRGLVSSSRQQGHNRLLPPLRPKDHWWIYNQNNYYQFSS